MSSLLHYFPMTVRPSLFLVLLSYYIMDKHFLGKHTPWPPLPTSPSPVIGWNTPPCCWDSHAMFKLKSVFFPSTLFNCNTACVTNNSLKFKGKVHDSDQIFVDILSLTAEQTHTSVLFQKPRPQNHGPAFPKAMPPIISIYSFLLPLL